MNLNDKARLIQDIQRTLKTIDNKTLPLIEQAKAAHHLKNILTDCKKDIAQQEYINQSVEQDFQKDVVQCLHLSKFKKTYRGVFHERSFLLQGLNEDAEQGWAILYDQTLKQWQIWVIPQALKGAIHCSWKSSLVDAYRWLLQQQQLLNCLINDVEYSQKTLQQESYTVIHLFDQEGLLTHLHIQPTLYRIDFMETNPQQPYVEWFTQTKNLSQIQNCPVYIAEKLSQHFEFLGYMVLIGTPDREKMVDLVSSYCEKFAVKINSVKTLTLDRLLSCIHQLDRLFECYKTARPIIPSRYNVEFIPKALLSKLNLVTIQEAPATKQTPVILLKEQQSYRIMHGKNRLQLATQEDFLPYKLFTRQQGMSWQKFQDILHTLPEPVSADTLQKVLSQQ